MKILFTFFSFFFLGNAHAFLEHYTYGSGTVKPGTAICLPIAKAQLFGERCSGTSFFRILFDENAHFKTTDYYGHKHFPCWFDYPYDEVFYQRPIHEYTLEGSDDCLFLVIFRNPYDWLRSFHEKPFCGTASMYNLSFSQFIRSPWLAGDDPTCSTPLDTNPTDKKPFKNLIYLRTAKIKNMLKIQDLVKNAYFINYETLKEHPKEVLQEIHEIFGIQFKEDFTSPTCHFRGSQCLPTDFKESQYNPISIEDLKFINETLDEEIENSIGYTLVQEMSN